MLHIGVTVETTEESGKTFKQSSITIQLGQVANDRINRSLNRATISV